jgi:hypothetical protein
MKDDAAATASLPASRIPSREAELKQHHLREPTTVGAREGVSRTGWRHVWCVSSWRGTLDSLCEDPPLQRPQASPNSYARMFTARAATRSTVTAERVDSAAINALAGRVSGIASVGLNAVAFVKET